jgi:hypothetical protein
MFGRNQAHAQDAAVQLLIRATTCAACNFQFILPFEICDVFASVSYPSMNTNTAAPALFALASLSAVCAQTGSL